MLVQLSKEFLGHKPGERLDLDEKNALFLIEQGTATKPPDNALGVLIESQIGGMFKAITDGLDTVITETIQKIAQAQTLSRKNAKPLIFGPDTDRDTKKHFGDWCYQVAILGTNRTPPAAKNAAMDRLSKVYGSEFNDWGLQTKAALGESSGVTGGYIVPPDFYDQLLTIVEEETFIRPRAFVQPMASATLQMPYLDITTAPSAGVSPFFGGVQMYWTSEAQTRTETEPTFRMMELKAQELSGYSVSSNILLQDSAFGLEKFLLTLFARAIAWYEEYAFLQGTGVGRPLGILNANATISVTRNTANTVKFVDVAKMFGNLTPVSQKRAIWAYSPTVIQQLIQLADAGNRALFMTTEVGGIHPGPNWILLGLPAFATEKLPALGTKGDLMLLDPQLYVIGDRMQIEVAASEHVNFLKNQMTWRVVERVDGRPWLDAAITLQDASSTVSPFVVLN